MTKGSEVGHGQAVAAVVPSVGEAVRQGSHGVSFCLLRKTVSSPHPLPPGELSRPCPDRSGSLETATWKCVLQRRLSAFMMPSCCLVPERFHLLKR